MHLVKVFTYSASQNLLEVLVQNNVKGDESQWLNVWSRTLCSSLCCDRATCKLRDASWWHKVACLLRFPCSGWLGRSNMSAGQQGSRAPTGYWSTGPSGCTLMCLTRFQIPTLGKCEGRPCQALFHHPTTSSAGAQWSLLKVTVARLLLLWISPFFF